MAMGQSWPHLALLASKLWPVFGRNLKLLVRNEKSNMINLISNQFSQEVLVISVWGMGGLGKTMLIKDVYRSQNLIGMFDKRPFNLNEHLKSLIMQLNVETSEKKGSTGFRLGAKTQ
jgi:hypothetical protein